MARRGYSARQFAGGFQPVQLSDGQIKRMRDDSNRVINNMERLRKLELQRGLETLQAMKENSAAEQQQRANNFKILQQNAQATELELQFERKKLEQEAISTGRQIGAERELARQTQVATGAGLGDFLGGLSKFAQGASQLVTAVEVEQEKNRQFFETLSYMGLSEEAQNDPMFKAMEDGLRISGLKYSQNLSLAEAQGRDPNSIARAREANPANRYASKKSAANWMLMNKFESYLNNVLSDTTATFEWNGQQVTFASARNNPRLMSAVQRFAFKQFVNENNLTLDRRFVKDGLNHVQKLFTANESRASQIEIKNSYARQEQTGFNILNNNPNAVQDNIPTAFNTWLNIPTLGYDGALQNYQSLATAQNPDGSFRFDIGKLLDADLKGTGKTFREEFPTRAAKMIADRDNTYLQQENRAYNLGKVAYKNRLNEVTAFLTQPGNNTQANINTAVNALDQQYLEYGGAGANLRRLQKSGSIEAIEKINLTKQISSIPSDFLTIEDVYAAYQVDPTLGAETDKRFNAKNNFQNSTNFKEVIKTFKTTANGITDIGTAKPNTNSSLQLQIGMKEELLKRVAERVKAGEPPESAVLVVGQQIENEVRQGFRNPESKYYRKLDGPGGLATFPKLNIGVISKSKQAARQWESVKKSLDENPDVMALASKPGSLFSKQEGEQLLQQVGTPYFKLPSLVKAVAGITQGGDPFNLVNQQLAAHGLKTIPVPASFTSVQKSASPELMKLLLSKPTVNNSARVMGAGNSFNPAVMPNQLGPVVQQFAQSLGVPESATAAFVQNSGAKSGKALTIFGQTMKTLTNPGDAALIALSQSGEYSPAQIKKAYHNFIKHHYAYGGGPQALNQSGLMRQGSPMRSMSDPLRQYSPQVSSVTFDTGQPGIDVFFEDKQIPAVLPGLVKDISYQGTGNTGYGNYLVIESIDPETGEKVDVLYSHLAVRPNLTPGQMIQTGQIIAKQGGTGRVVSADGTIASIDFLRPAPQGSKDMTPYRDFDNLRRRLASILSTR